MKKILGMSLAPKRMEIKLDWSLGWLLCFVALGWMGLLWASINDLKESMLASGFEMVNIQYQMYEAMGLLVLGILILKIFPEFKLKLSVGELCGSVIALMGTITVLIWMNTLAVPLFVVLFIVVVRTTKHYLNTQSDISIMIWALAFYIALSVIFFLEIYLFCDGAEGILASVNLITTCAISMGGAYSAFGQLVNSMLGKIQSKRDNYFSDVLIYCTILILLISNLCQMTHANTTAPFLLAWAGTKFAYWLNQQRTIKTQYQK